MSPESLHCFEIRRNYTHNFPMSLSYDTVHKELDCSVSVRCDVQHCYDIQCCRVWFGKKWLHANSVMMQCQKAPSCITLLYVLHGVTAYSLRWLCHTHVYPWGKFFECTQRNYSTFLTTPFGWEPAKRQGGAMVRIWVRQVAHWCFSLSESD